MQTITTTPNETDHHALPNLAGIKAKQKATWESGDFGQVARSIENVAEDFMGRLNLATDERVLDVACGTGNLALIAARHGCAVKGIDFAANLIVQARNRAASAGLSATFEEADAEALPFTDGSFDVVVSMFGVMFTPRPPVAAAELLRVTRPGGRIALATWTPEGFIGEMFTIFKAHLPPPPQPLPSPMEWGIEETVRLRLAPGVHDLRAVRRIAQMDYPFPPAETVDFFRRYYGPTLRAFESLPSDGQVRLRKDLVALQERYNTSPIPGTTRVGAEYLEITAIKS